MPKKEFCPYCGGHVDSGNCACGHNKPVYKIDPLFQSPNSLIDTDLTQKLKDHVKSLVDFRISMKMPKNIVTGRGIDPDAVAVISRVMADALLAYHYHWDFKPDPDRRSTPDILYDYIGRRTFIIEDAPTYEIKYYPSHHQVQEAYPDWWGWKAIQTFTVDSKEEGTD